MALLSRLVMGDLSRRDSSIENGFDNMSLPSPVAWDKSDSGFQLDDNANRIQPDVSTHQDVKLAQLDHQIYSNLREPRKSIWNNVKPAPSELYYPDQGMPGISGQVDTRTFPVMRDESMPAGIDLALPIDGRKMTYDEREQLIHILQALQVNNKAHGASCDVVQDRAHACRLASEQFLRIAKPNSMSGEDLSSLSRYPSKQPTYIWRGELPPRNYIHPVFSCKIFVGGVPWDVTEDALLEAFSPYGDCHIEWPGKEPRYSCAEARELPKGKVTGYVYVVFEWGNSVSALLQDCSQEFGTAGEWYFKLKAKRCKTTEIRQVQVIPWVISDASYVHDPGCRLDAKKTVFVGALHGMITANVLFSIMNEVFHDVVFVGIDTDKYKYPIGSGRVTFRSHASYFRAIESAFLQIKTSKFGKRLQIDPFLEDVACMMCGDVAGPYFCRDRSCFRYFCQPCWQFHHGPRSVHRPLMRNAPRITSGHHEKRVLIYNNGGTSQHKDAAYPQFGLSSPEEASGSASRGGYYTSGTAKGNTQRRNRFYH